MYIISWQAEEAKKEQAKFIKTWELDFSLYASEIWTFYENYTLNVTQKTSMPYGLSNVSFQIDENDNFVVTDVIDESHLSYTFWADYSFENGRVCIQLKDSEINYCYSYQFSYDYNELSLDLISPSYYSYFYSGDFDESYVLNSINSIPTVEAKTWDNINISITPQDDVHWNWIRLSRSSVPYSGSSAPEEWGEINVGDTIEIEGMENYEKIQIKWASTGEILYTKYDAPEGLIMYLNFDENLGTWTYDNTNNSHNAILYGPSWGDGISGYCLEFDGYNDYVLIDNNQDLDFTDTNEFTISLWTKRQGSLISKNEVIVSKGAGVYGGYAISFNTDDFLRFTLSDGVIKYYFQSKKEFKDTDWHHIALTWNGDTQVIYIDGVLDNTSYLENIMIKGYSKPLELGNHWAYTDNNHPFHGSIDEVRLYNYALTEEEIETLYNSVNQ